MGQKRILIVDDEPRLVHLVREVLTATGYEVLAVSTGFHAIESVAIEQPDLVLLDLMLPGGVDGYEVAQRIRRVFGCSNHYADCQGARYRFAARLRDWSR